VRLPSQRRREKTFTLFSTFPKASAEEGGKEKGRKDVDCKGSHHTQRAGKEEKNEVYIEERTNFFDGTADRGAAFGLTEGFGGRKEKWKKRSPLGEGIFKGERETFSLEEKIDATTGWEGVRGKKARKASHKGKKVAEPKVPWFYIFLKSIQGLLPRSLLYEKGRMYTSFRNRGQINRVGA